VPTFAEAGLSGFEPNGWFGFFLPAGTPREIADRLSAEIARITRQPDITQRLAAMGLQPVASTPAELATVVSNDTPKWAEIVRAARIQLD